MRNIVSPVGLFAVGSSWVQITWGQLPSGPITFAVGAVSNSINHQGGPGSHVIKGLPAGSAFEVEVRASSNQRFLLAGNTLNPPQGKVLTRFATISDLHLGARRWGFFKTMTEPTDRYDTPHPMRCAEAAIQEAIDWGAEILLIKGDAVNHEDASCFGFLGELVDKFPELPMMLIPGNHDVDAGAVKIPNSVGCRQLPYIQAVDHIDVPGTRIIMANSTKPSIGSGSINPVADEILRRVADSPSPVFLALHHQLQPTKIPRYWPKGIAAPESTNFLDRMGEIKSDVVVSSGHTHRNRARRHNQMLLTEVASTKDWPGVWAAYTVYEGGISQSVRRTGSPSVLSWTEYSQQAVGGLWSKWSPGHINDRCLSHVWARDPLFVG